MAATLAAGAASAAPAAQDRISLAAWSLNRSFRAGKWKNLELPKILRDKLGIDALEYVNQFFENPTLGYLRRLKRACEQSGVTSVLIMVDDEDPMAAPDRKDRMDAAIAHRKWVDVAHFLGCHAIRCNMRGGPADWKQDPDLVSRAAESFSDLLTYAQGSGLKIVIENHGGSSSNPDVLAALMKKINHPNFGLMVDLGNWNKGDDHYEAIRKTLPWAKSVSVKDVPGWDLEKKLRQCLDSGYHGFWGVESGARDLPAGSSPDATFDAEIQAALKIKAVLERVVLKRA
ncbi:MAG: sugar phosphate isomerase/epimerase [Acidobacteria bacterium]|nr:sugar phosphate isomerase/epimerase [Acidobacteriota bacterium]